MKFNNTIKKIIENFEDDEYEDDEDEDEEYSNLKSINDLKLLKPQLVKVSQAVYDEWDEENEDEYARGGICHFIVDAICGVLGENDIECVSVSSDMEQHVFCVAKVKEGIYSVDIHWSYYETGGGYSWKKIYDVEFDESMIHFYCISSDPRDFKNYVED